MQRNHLSPERLADQITEAGLHMYGQSGVRVGRDVIYRLLRMRPSQDPKGKAAPDHRPKPKSGDDDGGTISARSLQIIYNHLVFEGVAADPLLPWGGISLDPFFRSICDNYGIDSHAIDYTRWQYTGTFSFYAYSEDLKHSDIPYVVRGAISFFYCPKSRALMIKELQGGRRGVEKWFGYFWESGPTCVIIARRLTLHIPKFFVLEPERYGQRNQRYEVTELRGQMLKVGSSGGLFSSRVFMVRDQFAYRKCEILPASELPEVQPFLGPPPRH
jgi:hypothetical protein